jgi:hypothetical protein
MTHNCFAMAFHVHASREFHPAIQIKALAAIDVTYLGKSTPRPGWGPEQVGIID